MLYLTIGEFIVMVLFYIATSLFGESYLTQQTTLPPASPTQYISATATITSPNLAATDVTHLFDQDIEVRKLQLILTHQQVLTQQDRAYWLHLVQLVGMLMFGLTILYTLAKYISDYFQFKRDRLITETLDNELKTP